ncbi:MAG: hypothetical protein PHE24_03700 [Patescibacteria group bacterium]|nr:hypothetical protein [Patescibacteria group bacterium]
MKKIKNFVFLSCAVIFTAGVLTACSTEELGNNGANDGVKAVTNKVSVCDLAKEPNKYLNKTISVEGSLRLFNKEAEPIFGAYVLEDNNCKIGVEGWLPTSVATCPPEVKDCNPPDTIRDYAGIGKRVRINSGVFYEEPRRELKNGTVIEAKYGISPETKNGVNIDIIQ